MNHYFPCIHITSDWGRIGPIWWANSYTAPHQDPLSARICVEWGCFILGQPVAGHSYSERTYLD